MLSRASAITAANACGWSGKRRVGTSMSLSRSCVMRPISSCCGSSCRPGWPRQVTISKVGMRNGALSEVSGLTALPSPEFWHMTAVSSPASHAPAAMATASPSLAAPT